MGFDEINKLFTEHGLDPKYLTLYEEVYARHIDAYRYRLLYTPSIDDQWAYEFYVTREELETSKLSDTIIREHVLKAIRSFKYHLSPEGKADYERIKATSSL